MQNIEKVYISPGV